MYWTPERKTAAKAFIVGEMVKGHSLRKICRENDRKTVPDIGTVLDWRDADAAFDQQYARAERMRADFLFDEMLEIAFTTEEGETITEKETGTEIKRGDMLGHRRLKVDALKWAASKLNSKKYGDKIDHTTDGEKINQTIKVGYGKKDLDSYEDLL